MENKKKFTGQIGRTLLDTKLEFDVKESPSKGKPNVIYIVLDDMGFAQLGCYGSSINTPNIDRLAYEGIRFNNFHTTAICSATRCSLLTGANHHSAGISGLLEFTTGISNNRGGIDPQYATIAEILREYDYRTFAVGKWHLSTIAEMNPDGPYNNWPLGKGFDNYYGFLACQMNQWNPTLTRDNTYVPAPKKASEGYHLSEDLTDKAIEYIYHHEMEQSDQPFFLYLAYGAMHAPHHAPKEYIDKYKGKFDKGWDVIRSGISFYIKDNKLKYTYNLDGEKRFNIESDSELPLGEVEVSYRMELPDGKSGYVTAFINGQEVGRVDIPSVIWATAYPLGIRANKYSSVNDADYQSPFEYKGIIDELAIHVDAVNVKVEDELKRASNID